MEKNFNSFRFEGLNFRSLSNNYWTMNRVNDDETKIVVKVGKDHILKTKYGYALILDKYHVVFMKDWQVSENFFGTEVLLQKDFWNVKKWGEHENFFLDEEKKNHDFKSWLEVAKSQEALTDEETGLKVNPVKWEK